MKLSKKATINDVAEMAGVSITTVSRAINNNYPVKKETKDKIFKAIEKLDFTPNDLAVSMIKKKTNTIGVIIPSVTNVFFSTLVKGINDVLVENNFTMFLCTSDNNEEELVEKLANRQVDGIIIADSNVSTRKDFYKKIEKSTPVIFINGYDKDFDNVSSDQAFGTQLVIDYINRCEHKEVLFVRGSENSYSYQLKEDIFKEQIKALDILVVKNGNKDEAIENTKNSIEKYFSKNKNISVVFACNDLMAIGVIKGLNSLGINVPKDVSVIGFDNVFLSELIEPKLTTVDQQIYELGKIACEKILKQGENCDKINIRIDCKLIIRQSSQ